MHNYMKATSITLVSKSCALVKSVKQRNSEFTKTTISVQSNKQTANIRISAYHHVCPMVKTLFNNVFTLKKI